MPKKENSPCDTIPLETLPPSVYRSRDHDNQESSTPLLYGHPPTPVVLSPSWESRDVTREELNLKSCKMTLAAPKDRCNAVYFVLLLHGIGILMPWNMFITAKSYFMDYKLNTTHTDEAVEEYRKNFLSYLGVAAQIPNIIMAMINLFLPIGKGSFSTRVVGSIVIEAIIFMFTIILAMVDSSEWPLIFFYLTMASVIVLNMANGIYQSTIYGVAAQFPMRYSNIVVMGTSISGTLTAVVNVLSIAMSPNYKTAAIYYFIAALFILLACFDTFFALPLSRFYRHHMNKEKEPLENGTSQSTTVKPKLWIVFKKVWPECISVFLVFFVTLSVFPAVLANVELYDKEFPIAEIYFIPIVCFVFFNFFCLVGNLIPMWIQWPGPRFLWIPVFLRVFLIPLFMFCNYKPDTRTMPVFIHSDWVFAALSIILGLTNGYFSSLSMMYAPRRVSSEYAATAGMMAAFFLVLGIFVGVNFSFLIAWFVEAFDTLL